MKLLLDTHVLLWLSEASPQVPEDVLAEVRDPDAEVLLSAVVLWEIAIKAAKGRLKADLDFKDRADRFGFVPLPATAGHAWVVRDLPSHHRDPFDRLLVAQAQVEGATLVTADAVMRQYDVPVLWA